MVHSDTLGDQIARARRERRLRQLDLAAKSGISRATIQALENGRAGDIGISKLSRVLAALGLELSVRPMANERPTLDDLLKEDSVD